ncbi:MAG: DUF1343 domain-containing protein [Gemmatimonadales bacterium]
MLTAITLLDAVQRVHPDRIGFRNSGFDRLAGGPGIREAVQAGRKPAAIVASWKGGIDAFRKRVEAVSALSVTVSPARVMRDPAAEQERSGRDQRASPLAPRATSQTSEVVS